MVFAIENTVDDACIPAYFENLSQTRDLKIEGEIANYKGFVSGSMQRMSDEHKKVGQQVMLI